MAIRKISSENLIAAVAGDPSPVIDTLQATACTDSVTAAVNLENVETELEDRAKEIMLDAPETPKVKVNNVYTKGLTLDESLSDFDATIILTEDTAATDASTSAENNEDTSTPPAEVKKTRERESEDELYSNYLEFDMFDFIMCLVTDDYPRPKHPFGKVFTKFMHAGEDNYTTNTHSGIPQVSTDTHGNVVIYAMEKERFEDIIAVLDYYGIKHSNVQVRQSAASYWKFRLTIYVPMIAPDYPMLASDYFEDRGLTLSDVIKVDGANDWSKTHKTKTDREIAAAEKLVQEHIIEDIFTKYVRKAATTEGDLMNFVKEMFAELDARGIEYAPRKLKKKFFDTFDDGPEDED